MIQHDNLGRILIMEAEAAKLIGAGIAVLPLLGVGIGIGNIFSSLVNSIARNPSARNDVFGIGIVALLLLFVF